MQQAVRLQIELTAAQTKIDRWKTTQLSAEYSRASPAARKLLDEQRAQYSQEVGELSIRLNSAIKNLAELPTLPAQVKFLPSAEDEKQIMAYTTELKDWIQSLQLYTRIDPPQAPEAPKPFPGKLKDPSEQTIEHVRTMLSVLEDRADAIEETISHRKVATIIDVNATAAELQAAHSAAEEANLPPTEDRGAPLLAEANQLGDKLEQLSHSAADLILKSHDNQRLLAQLEAELAEREVLQGKVSRRTGNVGLRSADVLRTYTDYNFAPATRGMAG